MIISLLYFTGSLNAIKEFSSISYCFQRKELFYVLVVCMLYVKAKFSPNAGITLVNF